MTSDEDNEREAKGKTVQRSHLIVILHFHVRVDPRFLCDSDNTQIRGQILWTLPEPLTKRSNL